MKFLLFCSILVLAALAHDFEENEGIVLLNDTNFVEGIKLSKFVFVKFFAPWCGHCKQLAPKYVDMAKSYKEKNHPIVFAEVDASEQKQLKELYKIEGYPTLYLFVDQKPVKYTGGLTPEEMTNWINKRTGEQSLLLASQQDFDAVKEKHGVFLVYFGESAEETEFKTYLDVALSQDDVTFTHIFDAKLMASFGASLKSIILFKNFEDPKVVFSGEFTKEKIVEFIATYAQPIVIEFDEKSIDKIFQKQQPVIFLFRNFNDESLKAVEQFKLAAESHKEKKIMFCNVDPNNKAGHFNRLTDYLGVNTASLPKILILKAEGGMNKYSLSKPILKDNLLEFVNQFFADPSKLERFLKSAAIPEKNDQPVRVIVGKSFDDEVINNNKDVLVKFYAPWCGHCKQLAPLYEEAAKKLAINKNIVIAEMDSTQNETPRVSISGFPTLKFWPGNAKDKEPITYDGPRTAEGIIDWLKQRTTQPWVELTQQPKSEL